MFVQSLLVIAGVFFSVFFWGSRRVGTDSDVKFGKGDFDANLDKFSGSVGLRWIATVGVQTSRQSLSKSKRRLYKWTRGLRYLIG